MRLAGLFPVEVPAAVTDRCLPFDASFCSDCVVCCTENISIAGVASQLAPIVIIRLAQSQCPCTSLSFRQDAILSGGHARAALLVCRHHPRWCMWQVDHHHGWR